MVRPLVVVPTAPGSGPPWPASRKTVRWRSPAVGGNETHAPDAKTAGSTAVPASAVPVIRPRIVRPGPPPEKSRYEATATATTARTSSRRRRRTRRLGSRRWGAEPAGREPLGARRRGAERADREPLGACSCLTLAKVASRRRSEASGAGGRRRAERLLR